MTAPMPVSLPYGIRDLKLTPYADAQGSVLGGTSYDFPNMQTLSFSETEEFQELRGDDKLIATHGRGAQIDWSVEAGGISLRIWAILSGGTITETGTAPNRVIEVTKKGSDVRPYFRIDGQVISDSGGDLHCRIYRARCNDTIEGEFTDGEFYVTSASGVGMPLLDDTNDLLYKFIQHETKTNITLTPVPNPVPSPQNVQPGATTSTTVALTWEAVAGATGYIVEKAVSPYSTFTAVGAGAGGEPVTESTTVTGLTTATGYQFRVKAVTAAGTSLPSTPTGTVTTP